MLLVNYFNFQRKILLNMLQLRNITVGSDLVSALAEMWKADMVKFLTI